MPRQRKHIGLFLITLLAVIIIPQGLGKKIFRYQDSNGQWHYSDTPSREASTQNSFTPLQIAAEPDEHQLSMTNHGTEQSPDYYVKNNFRIPVEIQVTATQADNIISEPPLPLRRLIAPRTEQILFSVRQKNPAHTARFAFRYEEVFGDPQARHSRTARYRLPYADGQQFTISQAFHGRISHTNIQSVYAVDFPMPEGTGIVASRGGIVIEVKQDFFEHGTQETLKSQANSVRILHSDGTMAIYAHLKVDRIFVYEGDRVNAGDLLAESGNSGFSSGPHLHFAIQKNTGMRLESIPFKFTLSTNETLTPKQGMSLRP